ncbi:hypothetical protein TrRE_jg4215 [Triparma retinervis]|uniref:Uncharacterized protein n=1 Tax=Triparma retinervis TaxID=2557542 RepID=A0A9W7AUQ1_9STRA|nr:hypothetical protein TrRE_jg4215 [Triparma retinervis]
MAPSQPPSSSSSFPSGPSPMSRHAAAQSSKTSGLNDLFKNLCAEAMHKGMGEKEALQHAIKRIEEEMAK